MKKPSAKSVYTSFVATPEVYAAIKKAAEQQDRSQSWIVGKAVEEYLHKLGVLKKNAGC
ncbi:MAG: hypothetical protein FD126_88 [Elusimicrobia bacterium]|nr:MAG: hypothetical protein FD126_88 [Elusimicrobiota bacterium]